MRETDQVSISQIWFGISNLEVLMLNRSGGFIELVSEIDKSVMPYSQRMWLIHTKREIVEGSLLTHCTHSEL